MQARLKVLHDKANVKQVKLLPVTLIGRSTECNLKIASSQVSRTHCRITLGDDVVFVEDLGSANGTLVDGKPLVAHQQTPVVPGTTLTVGPAEFMIDYVASTSATLVLSRIDSPISPSLSSTELLLPAKKDSVPQSLPAAATSPSVETGAAKQSKVTAVPAQKPTSAQSAPQPSERPAAAAVEMVFAGFAAGAGESTTDDESPFSFGGLEESSEAPTSVVDPQSSSEPEKKGRLKSLFSMFGKKGKAATGAKPSAREEPAAPGVFLPTVDQIEAPAVASTADENPFGFETPDAGDAVAETVMFESPQQIASANSPEATPTDDDDPFQQFLKQV